LALLHAGFSVPRMSPPGRWALTPPFHPCQMRSTETGGLVVFPQACRRGASITGGLFSVALSVAGFSEASFRSPQRSAPWRYQARCPAVADSCELTTAGVRTFLPSTALASREPAITRLIRCLHYTPEGMTSAAGSISDLWHASIAEGGKNRKSR